MRAPTGPKEAGFNAWQAAAYADLRTRFAGDPAAYSRAKDLQTRLFLLRMRNGGELTRCNHSLYGYYGRFWDKKETRRPELFAQGYEGADQPPQMCYTSQALVEQVAQDARDYYDGKVVPGLWAKLPNPFPIEPMDNSSFCKCAECQKWIAAGKGHGGGEVYSKGIHSDYVFQFVNAVQRKLAETHPGKRIVVCSYMSHAWPPKMIKLDPRVGVEFAFATSPGPHSTEEYKYELGLVRKWGEEAQASGRPLYVWLYYSMYRWNAENGGFYCFPGFFAHAISEQMKLLKQLGYRGMYHCAIAAEVETYVTFRLMDNAGLDVDVLLDEYFKGMYGAAAAPMKQLYLGIEAVYGDPKSRPTRKGVSGAEEAWGYLGTAERMEAWGKLMEEAARLADTERDKRNVQLFDLAFWKYMTAGRAQFVERASAPIPSLRVAVVPEADGDLAKVAWKQASDLGSSWYQKGSATPALRKLSGRLAHDGTHLYFEFADPCDTSKLVASPSVCPFDDWEIVLAGRRALPYRQFMAGPGDRLNAISNGEVDGRMYVQLKGHGVRVVSDASAPGQWVVRVAIPLETAVAGGVKPGDSIYLGVIRVSSAGVGGQAPFSIDSWISHMTVGDVDRLAEITLEK